MAEGLLTEIYLHREKDRLETKYREHLDALTNRGGDLDTENRQLRTLKYELDTKVVACDPHLDFSQPDTAVIVCNGH